MSRDGAQRGQEPIAQGGTPIWVWLVYALGIFAAVVFAGSILFTLGAFISDDDSPTTLNIQTGAVVIWGALILAALALWIVRRRKARS